MTVGLGSKIQYTGDGVTVAFPFPYYFLANGDLTVIETTGGVDTTMVLGPDYAVVGAGNPAGGTVTFTVPPANGAIVTLLRSVALSNQVHYPDGNKFPAATIEANFDRLTMMIQQLSTMMGGVPVLPPSTTLGSLVLPNPQAGQLLGWNGAGNGLANYLAVVAALVTLAAGNKGQILVADATGIGIAAGPYFMFGNTTGAGSAYALAPAIAPAALADKMIVVMRANFTCGAAPTLNVAGFGNKPIVNGALGACAAADIVNGQDYILEYNAGIGSWAVISAILPSQLAAMTFTLTNPIINGSLQDNPIPFGRKFILRGAVRTISSYTTGVGGLLLLSAGHFLVDGDAFRLTAGSPPTGMALNTTYFARVTGGANTQKLAVATTRADALAGTNLVNLSGAVTGATLQPGYSMPTGKTKIYVEACIGGGGPGGSAFTDGTTSGGAGGGGTGGIARGFKSGVAGNFFTWLLGAANGGNSVFINSDAYGYVNTSVASASAVNDTITPTASPHNLVEGEGICFTAGSLPSPLATQQVYFVRNPVVGGLNTIQLSLTPGGPVIDLTTTTSGATLQPGLVGGGGGGGGNTLGIPGQGPGVGGLGGFASGATHPHDNIRGSVGSQGSSQNSTTGVAGGHGGSTVYGSGGQPGNDGGGGSSAPDVLTATGSGMGGGGGGASVIAANGATVGGGNGASGGLVAFE